MIGIDLQKHVAFYSVAATNVKTWILFTRNSSPHRLVGDDHDDYHDGTQ